MLILKRSIEQDVYPGYWDIPGGTVEEREDPMAGAIRETKEEAGLEIKNPELFYYTWNIDEKKNKQFLRLIFTANYQDGKIIFNTEEHTEYAWAPIKNMPAEYKLVDYLYDCLEKIKNHPLLKANNG